MRSFNLAESKLAERSFCKLQIIRHLRLILFVIIFVVLVAIGSYAEKSKLTKQVLSVQSKLEEIKRQRDNSQLLVEATKTAQHLEEWHNQLTG